MSPHSSLKRRGRNDGADFARLLFRASQNEQVPVLPRRPQQHRARSPGRRSTTELDPEGDHHPLRFDAEVARILGRAFISIPTFLLSLHLRQRSLSLTSRFLVDDISTRDSLRTWDTMGTGSTLTRIEKERTAVSTRRCGVCRELGGFAPSLLGP